MTPFVFCGDATTINAKLFDARAATEAYSVAVAEVTRS